MKNKRVLAVASQGGHIIQLMRLKPVFDRYQTTYVSNQRREDMDGPFYQIVDANRNEKLKLLCLISQLFVIIVKTRPDIIISSGAAPGFFAIAIGKLLGAKTIWMDSIANAGELSLSGKQAGRFSDLWLTQWPDLAQVDGPHYGGKVL